MNNYDISKREQIIRNLKLLLQKRLAYFNATKRLNFDAGEFDPIDGKIYPHAIENYSTIRLPYPYNPEANCPLWIKTITEIFENDSEKMNILQEFFGYCLIPDTRQKKAMLLLGESDCGKSTILWALQNMIGEDNCSHVPLKNLADPQFTPMLVNKLLNIDADVSKGAENYEDEFKKITSGEKISCNQKYIKTFTFIPMCRVILAANVFPRITDHSSAFYNRLLVVPCNRIFSENEQDKELWNKLLNELSGIFNWSVEGLRRLQARGMFEKNRFMTDAVQELRDESNPVDIFFRENIATDVSGNCEIEKMDLYLRYRQWCISNGNAPLANNKFGTAVYQKYSKFTPKDVKSTTGSYKRVWKNLRYVHITEPAPEGTQVQWQE